MQLLLDEACDIWTCTEKTKTRTLVTIIRPVIYDAKHQYLCCTVCFDDNAYLEINVFVKFKKITQDVIKELCKEVIKVWKESLRSANPALDVLHMEHICSKFFNRKSFNIFLFKKAPKQPIYKVTCFLEFKPHWLFSDHDYRMYRRSVDDFTVYETPFSHLHRIILD